MKHPTSAAVRRYYNMVALEAVQVSRNIQGLASGLTYLDAIDLSESGVEGNTEIKPAEEMHGNIPGGLSDADLRRFGLGPPRVGFELSRRISN